MGARLELGRRCLGQPDDAAIIAEIIAHQLRKPVEAEAFDDNPIEETDKIIGEEESCRFFVHDPVEIGEARVEGIAMRAFDPLDAFFSEHGIELTARATVAVEAEDAVVAMPIDSDLAP